MSNAGKLVKLLVKTKKESVMGKLGDSPFDDPMEPWSAKYNSPVKNEEVETLEEDSWLFSYIKSLGYNPKIMSFAQRSKYARSNAFKHYKQAHMERGVVKVQSPTTEEVESLDEAGTGLLMTYIKAKGLNPLTMDGNQKHAYARSSEFKIFKQKHGTVKQEEVDPLEETSGMGERGDDWNEETGSSEPVKKKAKKLKEELDEKDTVTMDIPLLIRVLEYAREDAKTDMDLHKVVENLINMRKDGTLSMAQYDAIVKISEEFEQIDELKKATLTSYATKARADAEKLSKQGDAASKRSSSKSLNTALQKYRKSTKRHLGASSAESKARVMSELKKMPDNMEIDDHITREEKKMKGADPCWKGYQMVGTKKKGSRTVPNCVPENVQEGIGGIEDSPLSATNSVKAMESAHRNKQMKSARMIKSLYKNKIKETTYDWEKDDKPNAKIVVKGGTTMTGQPRDTVEIEPMLKTRPNSAKPSN